MHTSTSRPRPDGLTATASLPDGFSAVVEFTDGSHVELTDTFADLVAVGAALHRDGVKPSPEPADAIQVATLHTDWADPDEVPAVELGHCDRRAHLDFEEAVALLLAAVEDLLVAGIAADIIDSD